MQPRAFLDHHLPALQADEVRHGLILAILQELADGDSDPRRWSLGAATACAVQSPGRPIVLGQLDRTQCKTLAARLENAAYPGLVGPEETALWTAAEAASAGACFDAAIPMQILALRRNPHRLGATGQARRHRPGSRAHRGRCRNLRRLVHCLCPRGDTARPRTAPRGAAEENARRATPVVDRRRPTGLACQHRAADREFRDHRQGLHPARPTRPGVCRISGRRHG